MVLLLVLYCGQKLTAVKGLAGMTYTDSIQLFAAVGHLTYGLIKASVFGAVIALVGSYKRHKARR